MWQTKVPVPQMLLVVAAVNILLDGMHIAGNASWHEWKTARKMFANPAKFLAKLQGFDYRHVHKDTHELLRPYLENAEFMPGVCYNAL